MRCIALCFIEFQPPLLLAQYALYSALLHRILTAAARSLPYGALLVVLLGAPMVSVYTIVFIQSSGGADHAHPATQSYATALLRLSVIQSTGDTLFNQALCPPRPSDNWRRSCVHRVSVSSFLLVRCMPIGTVSTHTLGTTNSRLTLLDGHPLCQTTPLIMDCIFCVHFDF